MKKNNFFAILSSLVLVVIFSFLITNYLLPIMQKAMNHVTYSETYCVSDKITEGMRPREIAQLYRDSNATVEVIGSYSTSTSSYNSLGSGVVVASTGYTTTTLEENFQTNQGSYIATNYHVIEFYYDSANSNKEIKVRAEDEILYSCDILWSDKNLDLAILYAEVSYNYVKMADRWIACEKKDRLDIVDELFTIGTPLEQQYLNSYSEGGMKNNNNITMFTIKDAYVYNEDGKPKESSIYKTSSTERTLLDNVYEQIINIDVGISGGNSGGGCFDRNGNLIGLVTLGTSYDQTDGNQINGAVPIYPIIQVLDRVIANNEASQDYKIYKITDLGFYGTDAKEAAKVKYMKKQEGSFEYYYLNGVFYESSYSSLFNFSDNGYCLLKNTNSTLSNIRSGYVIESIKVGLTGQTQTINSRNDLIYLLLSVNKGDVITINYKTTGLIESHLSETYTLN